MTVISACAPTSRGSSTCRPGAFKPAPKVRSTVVRLTFGAVATHVSDEEHFETVLRTMFTQRRKTLANA